MIRQAIYQLSNKQDLTTEQAIVSMQEIMSGTASNIQIASFLTALRLKGETIDEITAFAQVMREKAQSIDYKDDLFEIIANLQEENRLKKREINLYKARIKVLEQNSRGGYVATSIITIIGILILSGTIFTIIGRLLNH